MVKVRHSMHLFLEYMVANPNEKDTYQLFQNFAQRLYTGTFNREAGFDPSWLCWTPRSVSEAGRTIRNLTDFWEWWIAKHPTAAQVNPRYAGSAYDRMVSEAAYQFRRDRDFLGHTWKPHLDTTDTNSSTGGHLVMARRKPKVENSNPPAFPDDRFMELLTEGFVVGGRPNYRDMLITLLLHGAGFRYWFIPKFGDLFLTLWYRHLEQVVQLDRSHPFAWVNLTQAKGEMYTMTHYERAHARACRRIGLVVGKEVGTTPHGHRHAYGRRLVAGGFQPIEIKKFMHHHSLDSQSVYTTPTPKQVMEALAEGAERLNQKYRRDL